MHDDLEILKELVAFAGSRDHNEAETRHKIIDTILHEFLAWPKNRVSVEEHVRPGFADYILKKSNGDDLIYIEAKKDGHFFSLPIQGNTVEKFSYISMQKLMSDKNINEAMSQVRLYCFNSGCEYACITNGIEWIFLRRLKRGKGGKTYTPSS